MRFNNFFGIQRGGEYSAVRQSDRVYEPTTEPNRQSLSPTQEVFNKFLGGRLSRGNSKSKWVYTTTVCGLCAIILGSIIVAVDPYQIVFKMKVIFSEGSETFLMWEKPEVDLLLKVYLFNITNKDAFLKGTEKLKVQEVGPYVYKESMAHENVTFNENGTITAIPVHPLTWVPELSNGTEDDILVLPNIALLSFAQVMSTSSMLTRLGVNVLIRQTQTKPLVSMTAKEFMFGYKSTLLTLGNKLMPSWISFGKLGLIDRMYDFDGDISTTFSGTTDIHMSGLLDNYNSLNYLPQWEAPCNNVSGASDGTKFNSLISKDQDLLFFRKSLCRSMSLVRVGEEVVKGIHGYKYEFKNNSMDNGFVDPNNKCFCHKKCLPKGILDVHECYYGFPIALSYPHFYEVDEEVQNSIEGMTPNEDLHKTFFIINEESGLPLNLSVRMQINMAFTDLSTMANVQRFSNMILPMLWTDISMPGLPAGMNTKFYIYLTLGPILQVLATYLFLVGGVAFILLSLASALLIPKINLISSNRGNTNNGNANLRNAHNEDWAVDMSTGLASNKKRHPPSLSKKNSTSKEMDLYYCSLLAVQNEEC
ncbi:scavenger receptor class B member 1-like isoform X1 [Rhodnius prolixus]|uniref:scavenger receptor class B member 1-like isoform X1 n=2 Tax=Rhodnius prolixus TaxID=13249 RepID=UPI003D18A2CE